jgi:hypothetical protein
MGGALDHQLTLLTCLTMFDSADRDEDEAWPVAAWFIVSQGPALIHIHMSDMTGLCRGANTGACMCHVV